MARANPTYKQQFRDAVREGIVSRGALRTLFASLSTQYFSELCRLHCIQLHAHTHSAATIRAICAHPGTTSECAKDFRMTYYAIASIRRHYRLKLEK